MDEIAKLVLQSLVKIKENCIKEAQKEAQKEAHCKKIKPGIIDNLSGTVFLVQKVLKSYEPKTIGFFGAQKRGKSSLINQLLGCELMPVAPRTMSSVVIEIQHDDKKTNGVYDIDIIDSNALCEAQHGLTLSQAQAIVREYGSHKGNFSNDVDKICIKANFSESQVLEHGGILVDTPGAEVAFDHATAENEADAQRAIEILSDMHIVIFVERADLMQSENSRDFFTKHLKPMRPFSVINWKDAFSLDAKDSKGVDDPCILEAKKQSVMREIMLKTYGVNLARLLCVSCKDAKLAKQENDQEALERSNLPVLEKQILQELKNLSPENGLKVCLAELSKTLSLLDQETAEEVFADAKRPFFVMMNKLNDKNKELFNMLKEIYERYN